MSTDLQPAVAGLEPLIGNWTIEVSMAPPGVHATCSFEPVLGGAFVLQRSVSPDPFPSGFVLPAGTPREIVEKVSADTQAVLRERETVQRIVDRGGVPDPTTPQQYADFIRAEVAKWGEVARIANVKLD